MNADRLLAHFEKIADAPNAISRLRRFILDLAVGGRLVDQDLNDVPASALLEHARCRLKKRSTSGSRLRWNETEPVASDEIGRDIPLGWVPARINDTGYYINGLAFKPTDWRQSGLPIIRIQNLTDRSKEFNFAKGDFPDEVLVRNGDLLVSWSATLEAFRWDRGKGVLNQHIFRVVPDDGLTTRDFLHLLLRNAIREMAESDHAHGLVMSHINRRPFLNHVVLIPPLAEQRRIVAKVDELMTLCDRLETECIAKEMTRDRLMAASLARLNEPGSDPATFQTHAAFALDNLSRFTVRPDHIKALRQTILNLAVRGKLVEQNSNDEPASELLKRTAERKRQLKVKHHVVPLAREERPFRLPVGWQWSRIGELCTKTGSGSTPRGGKNVYRESGVPFLRSQNVYDDGLRMDDVAYVGPDVHARMTGTAVRPRDLLLNITGGSMGRCCRVPEQFNEANVSQHVAIIRPTISEMSDFLHRLVLSPCFQAFIFDEQTGAGRGGLPKRKMDRIAVAVPPLAEQHRIVAKVDELMALCDRLEASLAAGNDARRRLLDALLHAALSPSNEEAPKDISAIAQDLPATSPGAIKAFTHPTPSDTSPE